MTERAQRSSAECDFIVFNIYNKYILQYKIHVHIYIKLNDNAQDIKP